MRLATERMAVLYPMLGIYAFALPVLGVALPNSAAPVVWVLVAIMPLLAAAYVFAAEPPLARAVRSVGALLLAAALFAAYIAAWRFQEMLPQTAAFALEMVVPAASVLVLVLLGMRTIALDPRRRPLLLGLWLAAVAEVFLAGPLVGRLSDLKGNAGMDLAAMLLAPVLAFSVWAGVAGAGRVGRATA